MLLAYLPLNLANCFYIQNKVLHSSVIATPFDAHQTKVSFTSRTLHFCVTLKTNGWTANMVLLISNADGPKTWSRSP